MLTYTAVCWNINTTEQNAYDIKEQEQETPSDEI